MASHVYVVDSAFKRTQIKVTPSKYLREVLEEACKAKKVNPESYALKTDKGKTVDLSQPFRLSGLSAGAKLQLTQASRSVGVVNVALQLPENEGGSRFSDKFPSSTTLWQILRKFEDGVAGQAQRKLNLTQRAVPSNQSSGSGRLEYEAPQLDIMGRNLTGVKELQQTLSQLGYNSSSVLLRLSFKSSGQPLDEAMKEIEEYFSITQTEGVAESSSSASQEAKGAHAMPDGSMGSVPDASADNAGMLVEGAAGPEPAEPDARDSPMIDAPTAEPVTDDVIASSSETQPGTVNPEPTQSTSNKINGISVYRPPSSSTPAAALQQDDPAVFQPTIEGAKAHQASLERAGRNTRLKSDKELEEEEKVRQEALSRVKEVTVRVRYPDQSQIETTLTADDTCADLYNKVQGTLRHSSEPFELRTYGDKNQNLLLPNSSSKRLVRDFGFKAKILVTMGWAQEASSKARLEKCLNDQYASAAQEMKVNLQTQQAASEASHRAAMAKPESKSEGGSGKGKGDLESKMKKFLGFGKK
ncbi:Hypothetical predicted protein [Lecanosticta acicola]|uniref:TUG ubiquitin-like domain-containing protein n=1 Tax=Lecanosticta acicola TaxID=111012 RepID=A0AAI8YTF0_9PEZI|nr:Hypothetical predicted protein [Lecanosticta acicola]